MGRKMIKSAASVLSSHPLDSINCQKCVDEINSDEYEGHGTDLLKKEASLDYLCNLSTHR